MSRCVDCHWYDNPPPVTRNPESCADLGELAQNQACERFAKREIEVEESPLITPTPMLTYDDRMKYIGALMQESYKTTFHEILAENFVLAQDADLAVKTVQAQLQTQGANVDMPANDFRRYADKLIDLYVLYRLINAVGLSGFTDKIMGVEIERRFKQPEDK